MSGGQERPASGLAGILPAKGGYRYALAVLLVVAAWLIGAGLEPANRWLAFFPAVVAAGCVGGLGPGLLVAGVASIGVAMDSAEAVWGRTGELARIGVLLSTGALTGLWRQYLERIRHALAIQVEASRLAEQAQTLSEQRFRAIFDQAAVGICLATPEGGMKLVNQKLCSLLGYSSGELLQRTYQEITYPEDWPPQVQQAARLKAGEIDSYTMEKRYIRKDGSLIWASLTCSLIPGDPPYVVAIVADIAQRKEAEASYQHIRARYSALFDRSLDCVYLIGFDGKFIDANPAALELLGYTRDDIPHVDLTRIVDPACLTLALSRIEELKREGTIAAPAEFKVYRKDGQLVHLEVKGAVIYHDGKPFAIQGIARDITARRQAEAALRESEEKFRTLAETMHAAAGIVQGTRFVYANQYMGQMLGYSVEELLNMDFPQLVHPSHQARMIDYAYRRQLGQDVPGHYEFIAVTKAGEERWVDFTAARMLYQGKPAVIGTGFDITDRKRAQEELAAYARGLRLLADTATRLLEAEHPDDILQVIYGELADHLGASACWEYRLADEGTRLHLHHRRGLSGDFERELEWVSMGQTPCATAARDRRCVISEAVHRSTEPQLELLRQMGVWAYACHPLLCGGNLIGTLSFCVAGRERFTAQELELMRAVSHQAALALEHEQLRAQLRRHAAELAEANRAKDHFLATLSHELRTPLTPVVASLSLLEQEAQVPAAVKEDLEMIRRNVDLEARLIDDLLDLTRVARGKVTLDRRPVPLAEILEHVVEICAADLEGRGLQLEKRLEDRALQLNADPTRLEQVFWNLLKNAIKFTPPGGRLGVRSWREGEWALTEVWDQGQGIAPDLLPRIFEAFEQGGGEVTRQFGGLGLGLAICKAMVELHGGTITASSEGVGQGARFTVRLPLAALAAAEPAAPAGAPGSERTGHRPLRVLLVEDHGDTARVLQRALRRFGEQVQTASDVASALECVRQQGVDVLVSDLGLPDRSGLELIRELRAAGHQMPAVAMSGYGQEEDLRKSREAGFSEHLVKPVDIRHLHKVIEQVAATHDTKAHNTDAPNPKTREADHLRRPG